MENKYSLGELINTQTFSEPVVRKNQLETKTFSVGGREHPLKVIRGCITKNHLVYMRIKNDKEYENRS